MSGGPWRAWSGGPGTGGAHSSTACSSRQSFERVVSGTEVRKVHGQRHRFGRLVAFCVHDTAGARGADRNRSARSVRVSNPGLSPSTESETRSGHATTEPGPPRS